MTSFLIDPYRFATATAPWTPANITTALWLDASDATTITTSSGLVDQVNDKSGNGRNFASSSTARPTYSTNTLNGLAVFTYSGTQWLTSSDAASTWNFLHDTTGASIFVVYKAGNTSDPNALLSPLGNGAASSATVGFYCAYDDRVSASRNDNFQAAVYRGASGTFVSSNVIGNATHPANTACQISVVLDNANATAADRNRVRINGGAEYANNTQTGAASTGNATHTLQVGAGGNNQTPLIGYIAEIVITSGQVTSADRERIEGYLAHKWGLAGNLPAGHPYKSAAPTI